MMRLLIREYLNMKLLELINYLNETYPELFEVSANVSSDKISGRGSIIIDYCLTAIMGCERATPIDNLSLSIFSSYLKFDGDIFAEEDLRYLAQHFSYRPQAVTGGLRVSTVEVPANALYIFTAENLSKLIPFFKAYQGELNSELDSLKTKVETLRAEMRRRLYAPKPHQKAEAPNAKEMEKLDKMLEQIESLTKTIKLYEKLPDDKEFFLKKHSFNSIAVSIIKLISEKFKVSTTPLWTGHGETARDYGSILRILKASAPGTDLSDAIKKLKSSIRPTLDQTGKGKLDNMITGLEIINAAGTKSILKSSAAEVPSDASFGAGCGAGGP